MKMHEEQKEVVIYSDGACSGNPGPGGWGAVLLFKQHKLSLNGFEPQTTNNRMELKAVIEALKSLKTKCKVLLYTDSKYVQQGVTAWLETWKKNNWKGANKKPVKNIDLWLEVSDLIKIHNVSFFWVKGHSDNVLNNEADLLARNAIKNSTNILK